MKTRLLQVMEVVCDLLIMGMGAWTYLVNHIKDWINNVNLYACKLAIWQLLMLISAVTWSFRYVYFQVNLHAHSVTEEVIPFQLSQQQAQVLYTSPNSTAQHNQWWGGQLKFLHLISVKCDDLDSEFALPVQSTLVVLWVCMELLSIRLCRI
jgi:hypothetical protein